MTPLISITTQDCRSSLLQALGRPRQYSANDYHFDQSRIAGHAGYGLTIARNAPPTLFAKAGFARQLRRKRTAPPRADLKSP